jgi:hypothetical protein
MIKTKPVSCRGMVGCRERKGCCFKGVAAVLLLSSAVMAFIGMALIMWYNVSLSPRSTVFYPALYLAVFDFFVCALCFVGGVAALKRRFFPLTLASVFLLLASGIATFIAGS